MFKPNYKITPSILEKVSKFENLRGEIDNSFVLPEREISLRYRASVEATYSSTSIENNPLTKAEVEAVLAGKTIARARNHIAEVKNYKKALEYIEERKQTGAPISKEDILKIHKLTMAGLLETTKSGHFRDGPVYVVAVSGESEKILYTAPPASDVEQLIDRLLYWLNNEATDTHPAIVAAILHIEFVNIHPFADGNGRLSRLLVLLYLGLLKADFRCVLVPENYYIADRPAYYEAIRAVQGKDYRENRFPDLTSWIEYFTTGLVYSALEVLEAITLVETPLATRFKKKYSREEVDILSYVKQFGSISIETATEILPNRNRRTVQRRLKSLTENGQLRILGKGKNTIYLWPESDD